jgi:rare lipoprotein A
VLRTLFPKRATALRLALLAVVVGPILAACAGIGPTIKRNAFTSAEFGVAVSPRVTNNPNPPKGGGRYLVGQPYKVRGQVYTPAEDPDYAATGTASWYGADFHGRRTANGEIFSANAITGAHPTLPLPSYVRVTNMDNGRSMIVRLNDRGPYLHGRVMDVSYRAASILGFANKGVGNVTVEYVGPAPLNGDDTRMLLASVEGGGIPDQVDQGNTRLAFFGGSSEPRLPPVAVASAGQPSSEGDYSADDLASDFFDLFSYAEAEQSGEAILGAHAAVNAVAARADVLEDWIAAVDDDARAIKLQIGVFEDRDAAAETARQFALLAAVEEQPVTANGREAVRLTVTHLKPGVGRADVLALAQELGLTDLVLY